MSVVSRKSAEKVSEGGESVFQIASVLSLESADLLLFSEVINV